MKKDLISFVLILNLPRKHLRKRLSFSILVLLKFVRFLQTWVLKTLIVIYISIVIPHTLNIKDPLCIAAFWSLLTFAPTWWIFINICDHLWGMKSWFLDKAYSKHMINLEMENVSCSQSKNGVPFDDISS